MGKLFGVVLAVIALASAYPIVMHHYVQPSDISTHGHAIDEQLADTMAEAGLAFLGAQLLLAFFVWRFSERKPGAKVWNIPGGATLMVAAAFILVGTEILALGVLGQKAWANVYFTPPKPDAMQVQAQAGQFAFYFRYPGVDAKFGPLHPDKIDEGNSNFFLREHVEIGLHVVMPKPAQFRADNFVLDGLRSGEVDGKIQPWHEVQSNACVSYV